MVIFTRSYFNLYTSTAWHFGLCWFFLKHGQDSLYCSVFQIIKHKIIQILGFSYLFYPRIHFNIQYTCAAKYKIKSNLPFLNGTWTCMSMLKKHSTKQQTGNISKSVATFFVLAFFFCFYIIFLLLIHNNMSHPYDLAPRSMEHQKLTFIDFAQQNHSK